MPLASCGLSVRCVRAVVVVRGEERRDVRREDDADAFTTHASMRAHQCAPATSAAAAIACRGATMHRAHAGRHPTASCSFSRHSFVQPPRLSAAPYSLLSRNVRPPLPFPPPAQHAARIPRANAGQGSSLPIYCSAPVWLTQAQACLASTGHLPRCLACLLLPPAFRVRRQPISLHLSRGRHRHPSALTLPTHVALELSSVRFFQPKLLKGTRLPLAHSHLLTHNHLAAITSKNGSLDRREWHDLPVMPIFAVFVCLRS